MKGLRKSLAVLAALAMLLTLVPTIALAEETGTVSGTFETNAVPTVSKVDFPAGLMTPQVNQTVTVTVSDADKLSDLTEVKLVVYYDSDGTYSDAEAEAISAGDTKTAAIFTWTITDGTPAEVPTMDPAHSDTTGSIISWVLGTCTKPADMTVTSDDFVFVFQPGKVATEAPSTDYGSAKWHFYAKATDSSSESGEGHDGQGATMGWYGEITVGPPAVDFGKLAAWTTFATCTPQTLSTDSGIIYVSNGDWDAKVKSTSAWGGATLEPTETAPASMTKDTFSLKANKDATLDGAVMVDTSDVAIDETGGLTDEEPTGVTTNTLWIQLASDFTAGSYNGTITYIVADGA